MGSELWSHARGAARPKWIDIDPATMERSVQLIVAGGLALVAGLWLAHAGWQAGIPWPVGAAIALAGTVALGAGIARDLTGGPFDRI